MRLALRSVASENACPCRSSTDNLQTSTAGRSEFNDDVYAERHEQQAMRNNARAGRESALDDHPSNGEPFQSEGVLDEQSAFGRVCNCRHRTFPGFIL